MQPCSPPPPELPLPVTACQVWHCGRQVAWAWQAHVMSGHVHASALLLKHAKAAGTGNMKRQEERRDRKGDREGQRGEEGCQEGMTSNSMEKEGGREGQEKVKGCSLFLPVSISSLPIPLLPSSCFLPPLPPPAAHYHTASLSLSQI